MIGATAAIAAASLLTTAAIPLRPLLVWNASESVPTGLYLVLPQNRLDVGDLVLVEPPIALAADLSRRGYLPAGTPILKRVAALTGQEVCRAGNRVSIDGELAAIASDRDSAGRPLARWSGCRQLRIDEVFLLNREVARSLDGRYFGPLPLAAVLGLAVPLWTAERPRSATRMNAFRVATGRQPEGHTEGYRIADPVLVDGGYRQSPRYAGRYHCVDARVRFGHCSMPTEQRLADHNNPSRSPFA